MTFNLQILITNSACLYVCKNRRQYKTKEDREKKETRQAPTYDSNNNNKGNFVIRIGICHEVSFRRSLSPTEVKLPHLCLIQMLRNFFFFSFFQIHICESPLFIHYDENKNDINEFYVKEKILR